MSSPGPDKNSSCGHDRFQKTDGNLNRLRRLNVKDGSTSDRLERDLERLLSINLSGIPSAAWKKENVMNKWFTMAVGLAVFVLTGVTVRAQEPIDSIVIRKGTLFLGTIVPVCSQCGQYHKQGNCKTGLNKRPIDKSSPKIAESAGNRNRRLGQAAAESTQGTVQRPVSCVCNGKGCNYCSRSLDHVTRRREDRTSDIKAGTGRENTTRQGAGNNRQGNTRRRAVTGSVVKNLQAMWIEAAAMRLQHRTNRSNCNPQRCWWSPLD